MNILVEFLFLELRDDTAFIFLVEYLKSKGEKWASRWTLKKRLETFLTRGQSPNDHFWVVERDVTDSNSLKLLKQRRPRASRAAIDKRDISFRVQGERPVALSITLASQGTHASLFSSRWRKPR